MFEAVSKIVPIILFISIGFGLQIKNLVDEKTMGIIKKGVLFLALPAVLFIAFMTMALKKEYFLVSIIIFVMMYLFYLAGTVLNKILRINSMVLPFLTTGFAFGLLGIPLFGGVYGLENVGVLSVFGVGHEFFAWFIYFTLVRQKLNGEKFSKTTITNFVKSPIILAIVLGLIVNLTGFTTVINQNALLKGIENTLQAMADLTTPLILIIIGYGIRLEKNYMNKALQLLVIRMSVVFAIGYIIKWLVMMPLIGETTVLFDMAYYTFLLLPPPFMLAVFVSEYSTKENAAIANNTIVLSTLVCIVLFAVGVFVKAV